MLRLSGDLEISNLLACSYKHNLLGLQSTKLQARVC